MGFRFRVARNVPGLTVSGKTTSRMEKQSGKEDGKSNGSYKILKL